MDVTSARARFRALHEAGTFVMPNPHDVGSCRLLTALGFEALATTSGGFALSLGRPDMTVGRDRLCAHVAAHTASTELPLNVDAEDCFPTEPGGVAATVAALGVVGASGCSIEDYDPASRSIVSREEATDRVGVAAAAAREHGIVLTARAENHLRGVDDLDDTIARLTAYRAAGADVLYAPRLGTVERVARVVAETGAPVNVLLQADGPTRDELAAVGVRRLSVGGSLAALAYSAYAAAATVLLETGVLPAIPIPLDGDLARRALRADD